MAIVQLFLLLQYALPYIKVLLQRAYDYECEHHVSQRVLAKAVEMAIILGRKSREVGGSVSKWNDGKLSQVTYGVTTWWVKGVTGGIYDGVGEGLILLRSTDSGPSPDLKGRWW